MPLSITRIGTELVDQIEVITETPKKTIIAQENAYGFSFILKNYFKRVDTPENGDLAIYTDIDQEKKTRIYQKATPELPDSVFHRIVKKELTPKPLAGIPESYSQAMTPAKLEDGTLFLLSTALTTEIRKGLNATFHSSVVKKLEYIDFPHGDCFHYALGKILKTYIIPKEAGSFDASVSRYQVIERYFTVTATPQVGDLTVYLNHHTVTHYTVTHFGIYCAENLIESKWGSLPVYRHEPFFVPLIYGDFIKYYRLKPGITPEKLLEEFFKTAPGYYARATDNGKNLQEVKNIVSHLLDCRDNNYGLHDGLSPQIFLDLMAGIDDLECRTLRDRYVSYVMDYFEKKDDVQKAEQFAEPIVTAGFGNKELLAFARKLIYEEAIEESAQGIWRPLTFDLVCKSGLIGEFFELLFEGLTSEHAECRVRALTTLCDDRISRDFDRLADTQLGTALIRAVLRTAVEDEIDIPPILPLLITGYFEACTLSTSLLFNDEIVALSARALLSTKAETVMHLIILLQAYAVGKQRDLLLQQALSNLAGLLSSTTSLSLPFIHLLEDFVTNGTYIQEVRKVYEGIPSYDRIHNFSLIRLYQLLNDSYEDVR